MVNITIQVGVDIVQATITKEDKDNIDKLVMKLPFNFSISIGDKITFKDNLGTTLFVGYVQNIKTEGLKEVECYDLGSELLQRVVNYIFINQSPESIIQYVLTNYTTLTYVSTIVSGAIIPTYVANKKRAWDIVTEMSELMQANFRVDNSGNFQLEQEGEENSIKSISTANAILTGSWEEDKSSMCNSATVDGEDRQLFEKEQLFSGTGAQTTFTLSEIPESVRVEYPVGTLNTGYVPNQTTGQYYVVKEQKQIIFSSAPASGTNNIKVTFTYSIPVSVRLRNASSIALYGQHDKVFKKPYIKSRDQARDYANYIITKFANPLLNSTWTITRGEELVDFNNWLPNQRINVSDNIRDINRSFIIKKVEYDTSGTMKVTIGDEYQDILFWQKEAQQRIKQLEEKSDNSTLLTEDEYITDSVTVELSESISYRARFLPDDALVWGNANDTPVYANIGDGTERPFRDATGGVQPYFYLADANVWSQEIVVYPVELLLAENGDFLTTETGEFFYRQ